MFSAAEAIAELDDALALAGQDIGLQVVTAGVAGTAADCRALVRGYKPSELVGGIVQNDSKVILSPTGLATIPVRGMKAVIGGVPRHIEAAEQIKMDDTLVRIVMWVKG